MAVQLFKHRSSRIQKVFPLFPTLKDMAKTPNGRKLSIIFKPYIRNIVASFSLLVPIIKLSLEIPMFGPVLKKMFFKNGSDPVQIERTFDSLLTNYRTIVSCLALAHSELINIHDHEEVVQANHFISFYNRYF